jgi:hypothetical protein
MSGSWKILRNGARWRAQCGQRQLEQAGQARRPAPAPAPRRRWRDCRADSRTMPAQAAIAPRWRAKLARSASRCRSRRLRLRRRHAAGEQNRRQCEIGASATPHTTQTDEERRDVAGPSVAAQTNAAMASPIAARHAERGPMRADIRTHSGRPSAAARICARLAPPIAARQGGPR